MSDRPARVQTNTETGDAKPGLRVPFSAEAHAAPKTAPTRGRLKAAVAAKLVLDLLFVCSLAAYAQAVASRADYEGALEQVEAGVARGWVAVGSRQDAGPEVQLYVDGRLAASALAELPRAEARPGGPASEDRRGFELKLEPLPPGEHEARVYAVSASRGGSRRTLRQVGNPLRFFSE